MTVLITGGAGFIGSHLVDALLARSDGHDSPLPASPLPTAHRPLPRESDVVVLDNFRRGHAGNLAHHAGNPRLRVVEGDVRDAAAVRAAMAGADTVFHLAAQSNVLGAVSDPRYSFETNVAGTFNILEAAAAAGVRRVMFASSREAYGEPRTLPVAEDAPLNAKNGYGASKAAGELYCRAFARAGAVHTAILRLANVYGPRDFDRVIPRWVGLAEAGAPLELYGGDQVIDFVPVRTVVEAFLRAAETDEPVEPVNVGSGAGTPILTLAQRILALTASRSELRVLPARGAEVRCYVADTGRMRTVLGVLPPADPLVDLPLLLAPVAAGVR